MGPGPISLRAHQKSFGSRNGLRAHKKRCLHRDKSLSDEISALRNTQGGEDGAGDIRPELRCDHHHGEDHPDGPRQGQEEAHGGREGELVTWYLDSGL